MNKATVQLLIAAGVLSVCPDVALSQVPIPSVPAPLSVDGKFRLYLPQTYSLPSVLVPAAFAGLDQAMDSSKEWGQSWRRSLTAGGRSAVSFRLVRSALLGRTASFMRIHPSSRQESTDSGRGRPPVAINTATARSDRGTRMPAFGNYAAAIGGGFFPSAWLPPSASSLDDSLKRNAAILELNAGINDTGIEFGTDNRRFFHNKLLRPFHRGGKQQKTEPKGLDHASTEERTFSDVSHDHSSDRVYVHVTGDITTKAG